MAERHVAAARDTKAAVARDWRDGGAAMNEEQVAAAYLMKYSVL